MKDLKIDTYNLSLIHGLMKIKKTFFKDNVLKNPSVFVLLSQKMKIIF